MKSRLPMFFLLTLLFTLVTQARDKNACCSDATISWSPSKEPLKADIAKPAGEGFELSSVHFLVLDI